MAILWGVGVQGVQGTVFWVWGTACKVLRTVAIFVSQLENLRKAEKLIHSFTTVNSIKNRVFHYVELGAITYYQDDNKRVLSSFCWS